RRRRAREDEEARVARDLNVVVRAADEFLERAVRQGDVEDGLAATLARREVDGTRVGREGVVLDVRVELRQKLASRLGLSVVEHQAPAVALEPSCRLRAVCEVATVGRVARRFVRAGVRARQSLWFTARHRN